MQLFASLALVALCGATPALSGSLGGTFFGGSTRRRFVATHTGIVSFLEPAGARDKGQDLVVMLHGFPESAYLWEKQMQPVLDAGFWPVAMDLRGYGLTRSFKRNQNASDYVVPKIAGDVLQVLRRKRRDNAVLIAHDFGTALAMEVAARHPEKVRGVMMVSIPLGPLPFIPGAVLEGQFAQLTALGLEHYTQYMAGPLVLEEFNRNPRGWLSGLYGGYGSVVRAAGTPWVSEEDATTAAENIPAFFTEAEFDREVKLLEFAGGIEAPANFYYQNYVDVFANMETYGEGAQLQMPYAFLAGAQDPLIPSFEFALGSMQQLPGYRFQHLIENAGHHLLREAPAECAQKITEFLRSL